MLHLGRPDDNKGIAFVELYHAQNLLDNPKLVTLRGGARIQELGGSN